MKERKTLRDSINHMRNESYEEGDFIEEPIEEGNYTLQELKDNLFSQPGLEEVIEDFKETSINTKYNTLIHSNVDREASSVIGIPPGQYIGLGQGSALNHDILRDKMSDAPRGIVEKAQASVPLLRINDIALEYSQEDLITSIRNNSEVEDIRDKQGEWLLVGNHEVTHLSTLTKRDIIDKIEETLEKYDKISEPKKVIQHYIQLKNMLPEESSTMLYCDILDKCIMVLE